MNFNLRSRAAAEFLGTAFLLMAIVGSGIMADRLAGGNVALALLANSLATGAALVSLILALGPICGAHFNPAVTLADAVQGGIGWREVPAYVTVQIIGASSAWLRLTGCSACHYFSPLIMRDSGRPCSGASSWPLSVCLP